MFRFVLNCEFCIIHLILIHILSYAVMTINVTLPVLINLHWLPIDHRILYKILLYVFECLNNLAPGYLTELIIPYNPTRALRSETANLLTVPSVRTKTYGERRFDKPASTLCNNLPSHLRNAKNIECFKRLLKTHLFRQAYDL